MSGHGRFRVQWFLGVPFTHMTLPEAAREITDRDPAAPFCFVTTPNAQHAVSAWNGSPAFREAQDRAWMVLNDSRILGFLADRLFHAPLPVVAGSDLTAYLFAHQIGSDDSLAIIGGSAEVERRLRAHFGMSRIARFNPPMGFYIDYREVQRCVEFVITHPARYIFLSVGAPQSEALALAIQATGRATGVGLCIGSSLHFVTGVVRRAPKFVQRLHLESLWRLLQNPRRHARRVFIESLPVLWIAIRIRRSPAARRTHQRPNAS
jgi:N-acetylglucosaminyldiphosphoundecaprenol N-acetyl-beta-D-mannosaminyltransferase